MPDEPLKSFEGLREKMGLPPKGPRKDGRNLDEMRTVSIELGFHRPNQVLVSYGNTKVLCSASIENRVPQWRYGSGLGWLTAEYSMLPGSTDRRSTRERGINMSGRTYEIQRLIGRSLRTVVRLGALGQCTIYIDCDVISADGGTRTASITGGFLAMYSLFRSTEKRWGEWPVTDAVCAVSAGIVDGKAMLDLAYDEDSTAQVDANLVMLKSGKIVDFGIAAEESSFTRDQHESVLALAEKGCKYIFEILDAKTAELDAAK